MRREYILGLIILVAGGLGGWFLNSSIDNEGTASALNSFHEERAGGYEYINPLLSCDIAESLLTHALRPFKIKVVDLVQSYIDAGKIKMASVYFRDLNNGPWFGINEKEVFAPASLLKVPIMMAILKKSDSDPRLLERQIKYKAGDDANTQEHFKPILSIQDGRTYTVEELLNYMIIYSDNNAKNLLISAVDPGGAASLQVLTDLGIAFPSSGSDSSFITVRDYSSFFRVLFNASYVSKAASEKALSILAKAKFNNAIDAPIPDTIAIAHKFGERELTEGSQLHDCGIIYFPNHPYMLCVMTRGANVDILAKAIAEISKMVYGEVRMQSIQ